MFASDVRAGKAKLDTKRFGQAGSGPDIKRDVLPVDRESNRVFFK
jgi:hypothetical protein